MVAPAFKKLDACTRKAIIDRIIFRKKRFLSFIAGTWKPSSEILLVGDRPAPSAPDDKDFHYTPFGALRNSSLWLNLQLHAHDIPEENLIWMNAADLHGAPTSYDLLVGEYSNIVALGGNAARWLTVGGIDAVQVYHPQAWKRFKGKEPYPLMQLLDPA
jgi:hypothetical protein